MDEKCKDRKINIIYILIAKIQHAKLQRVQISIKWITSSPFRSLLCSPFRSTDFNWKYHILHLSRIYVIHYDTRIYIFFFDTLAQTVKARLEKCSDIIINYNVVLQSKFYFTFSSIFHTILHDYVPQGISIDIFFFINHV